MTTGLYIHVPFCTTKCAYCDFFSEPLICADQHKKSISTEFITALCTEIKVRVEQFSINEWSSVYIGGGTPSLLSGEQLSTILNCILQTAQISQNCEITIEANPETLTREWLLIAQESGINRLSLGIQSFDDDQLKAVHRSANSNDCLRALDLIQLYWKGEFSVDLIAGLPGAVNQNTLEQGKTVLKNNLQTALQYKPNHISLYTLTIEKDTPLYFQFKEGRVVQSEDEADSLWLYGRDFLEENSYSQYEVSNFAKSGFESSHNSAYWQCLPYIGCGPAACGTIQKLRYTNTRNIKIWMDAVATNSLLLVEEQEELSEETRIFEFLFMGFRTIEGVSSLEFYKRFNSDITQYIEPAFSRWSKRNLAQLKNTVQNDVRYALTKEGLLFLNSFCTELNL